MYPSFRFYDFLVRILPETVLIVPLFLIIVKYFLSFFGVFFEIRTILSLSKGISIWYNIKDT